MHHLELVCDDILSMCKMSCCIEHLLPNLFDGCKIVLQKGLSKYFQTSHSLTLGSTSQPAQWQFGSTYVGSKKVGPDEVRFEFLLDEALLSNFIDFVQPN